MVEELAYQQEIDLIFDIEPKITTVRADPLRLKQIMLNLLSNAIKFNKQGGTVNLKMFKSEDRHWVICQIQDTGIGIPADKISQLFMPFSQVDTSYSRKTEGIGLGLVLTKQLVELLGGTITVESQEGIGSVFTVKLPL